MRSRALHLALLLLGTPALASSPRTDLEPLRWLAGEWQGDGPTGRVEAFWLPPAAGTMAGVVRRIREGRVFGYSIAVLSEQDGSVVLRFKRFDARLAGRESEDAPPPRRLLAISSSEVAFEGVRLLRTGDILRIEFERAGERADQLQLSRVTRSRPAAVPASAPEPPVLQAAPGATSPPARISVAAWLAGDWTGQGLGGVAEEAWLVPAAASVAGVFRATRGGQVTFYELMTVVEVGGSLVFRLKHFGADLRGWESPERAVDFALVRSSRSALQFDGLTYRRSSSGLEAWVLVGLGDGGTRSERFLYAPRTP
ncbi:MAG: DUF6265 family protein [Myxococcaceae bacterium]